MSQTGDFNFIGLPVVGNFCPHCVTHVRMKAYTWGCSLSPLVSDGAKALALCSFALLLSPASSRAGSTGAGPLRTLRDVTQPASSGLSVSSGDDVSSLVTVSAAQRLVGTDAATGDYEGASVSIDGDTAVVAAPYAAPMGRTDAGAVYIFVRSGANWTQQAKLVATDGRTGDNFGTRVALRGDTLIIGAPGADQFGRTDVGAAYVFARTGTSWAQVAKLTAFDGASDDQFGFAVSLDGDYAVVGARGADLPMRRDAGAAYVFGKRGPNWGPIGKLTASDAAAGDSFGVGVAISGDTLIIGADFADPSGKAEAGAAYVFQRGPMGFSQTAKLLASDGQSGDWFGRQVAIDGTIAVVSSLYGDAAGKPNAGSAYVFVKGMMGWSQQAKLGASDGQSNDWFGYDVAVSGEQILVGAPYVDLMGISDAGAGYAYLRSGSMWTQTAKLTASDVSPSGFFGNGAAVDGDTFLVGAPGRPPGGAAYAFIGRKGNGEACLSPNDCGSGFCVDGVCCNSACGGGTVDCQACSVAAGAAANGVCGPARGGTICRPAAGGCDQAETCTGMSVSCPADVRKPRGSQCRPASHGCDAEEQCDGQNAECPFDVAQKDGTRCELGSCQLGQCRIESDVAIAWEVPTLTVTGFTPGSANLIVSNKGPSPAYAVAFFVEAPAHAKLSAESLPGWSCTQDSSVLQCLVATLPTGDTKISVQLTPPPVLAAFELPAQVTAIGNDPDPSNNRATLKVQNDNPMFEQLSGGGSGCAMGATGATGAPGAALSMILAMWLVRRRGGRSR